MQVACVQATPAAPWQTLASLPPVLRVLRRDLKQSSAQPPPSWPEQRVDVSQSQTELADKLATSLQPADIAVQQLQGIQVRRKAIGRGLSQTGMPDLLPFAEAPLRQACRCNTTSCAALRAINRLGYTTKCLFTWRSQIRLATAHWSILAILVGGKLLDKTSQFLPQRTRSNALCNSRMLGEGLTVPLPGSGGELVGDYSDMILIVCF